LEVVVILQLLRVVTIAAGVPLGWVVGGLLVLLLGLEEGGVAMDPRSNPALESLRGTVLTRRLHRKKRPGFREDVSVASSSSSSSSRAVHGGGKSGERGGGELSGGIGSVFSTFKESTSAARNEGFLLGEVNQKDPGFGFIADVGCPGDVIASTWACFGGTV